MTGPRLLIRTPSRLHFGLLGWGPGSRRQFGGLGLMIESPAIELTVEHGHSDVVEGPMADRVRRILATLRDQLSGPGIPIDPLSIRIVNAPPEHVGLGVGTQISLAIAAAVFQLVGFPRRPRPRCWPDSPVEAAVRVSACTVSSMGASSSTAAERTTETFRRSSRASLFPADWSVIVVQPPGQHGLNGPDEVRAFADLPPVDESMTERLCRLVLLGVLPAVAEGDLDGFGAADRGDPGPCRSLLRTSTGRVLQFTEGRRNRRGAASGRLRWAVGRAHGDRRSMRSLAFPGWMSARLPNAFAAGWGSTNRPSS